jgi:hypothetical protein
MVGLSPPAFGKLRLRGAPTAGPARDSPGAFESQGDADEMAASSSSVLKKLEQIKDSYGTKFASSKLELLRQLERRRLGRADEVLRLHECLCFLRAYPDDRELLAQVERVLGGFARRGDLRRRRGELENSGIAGTSIYFSFFWITARWLARRWPDRISIDWREFEKKNRLEPLYHLLLPYTETPALDMLDYPPRDWLDTLKGPDETDATFLVRRFEKLRSDVYVRETLYESLDVPMHLAPGEGTPNRTLAKYPTKRVHYQTQPMSRARPSLSEEVYRPPRSVRAVPPREARKLIDLTREAMVTRIRDLYVFLHADEHDVRIVDCGNGLQFVCIGAIPMRRLMFEALYGFLTLKNGVPIGYVLSSSLFGTTEVAYNVFESFRGAEAGYVFGRVLAMMHELFGSEAFSIDPYQLGYGNAEGLKSGAWWFYYKLGFRPEDPDVRRVLRGELREMKRNRRHRSDLQTLNKLASSHVYLDLRPGGGEILGRVSLGHIGLRVSTYLAQRFGADREGALRTCSGEAASLLGVRSMNRFTPGERLVWERWGPLVLALPGVERWSRADRQALARIVRAKGGRRESAFLPLFNRHRRLQRALLAMAREE